MRERKSLADLLDDVCLRVRTDWRVRTQAKGVLGDRLVWLRASTIEAVEAAIDRPRAGRPALEDLLADVADWGERTFTGSTDTGRLKHLEKELMELIAAPASGEEIADILMILAHHARAHRIDLVDAVMRKFAVVQARTWGPPDADGVVEHVREEEP